jgi:hypothetical protein
MIRHGVNRRKASNCRSFLWDMRTNTENGVCGGAIPPSLLLVFGLDVCMEDENCDVKFSIREEKGLEAIGMD